MAGGVFDTGGEYGVSNSPLLHGNRVFAKLQFLCLHLAAQLHST